MVKQLSLLWWITTSNVLVDRMKHVNSSWATSAPQVSLRETFRASTKAEVKISFVSPALVKGNNVTMRLNITTNMKSKGSSLKTQLSCWFSCNTSQQSDKKGKDSMNNVFFDSVDPLVDSQS